MVSKISLPRLESDKEAASIPDDTVRGPSVSLHPLCDDILEAKMYVDTDPMSLSLLGVGG